ncbi:uncharacterized protein LOC18442495 [Amborella trichopoda]|uniref:uncharacterized protein LOC18442495 n=1 Tax=Amborella trichopoda TaxID=13333 RepID=UPI0009BD5670|nr:uncharacterized protein LOC18442495 [Amborella trichopoda]|eukprot:XP_020528086.1 uncharacterized protein LOC18442495 [Amborella trichopoda]
MDSDLSMIHHLNDDICALSERVTTQKSSIRKERHEVDLETTWETRKSKRKVAFSASPEWAAMNDDSFASTVEVDKMVDEALDVMAMRVIERASKWASQKNAALYEAQDQIAFLRRSLEEVHPQKEEEHANASRAQAEVKELCLRAQADAKSTQAEVLKAHAEAKDAHFQKEAAQAEVLAMKVRDRRSQIATSLGILPVPQTSQGPSTSEFERLRSRVILYWSECQRLRAERDHALHEHASSAAVVIALETALAIGGSDPSPIIDRALARCPRPPPLERTQSLAISGCSLRVGAGGSRKVESTSRPRADDQEAASSHRSSRGRSSHSPGF